MTNSTEVSGPHDTRLEVEFSPKCSCGWEGVPSLDRRAAATRAKAHAIEHQSGPRGLRGFDQPAYPGLLPVLPRSGGCSMRVNARQRPHVVLTHEGDLAEPSADELLAYVESVGDSMTIPTPLIQNEAGSGYPEFTVIRATFRTQRDSDEYQATDVWVLCDGTWYVPGLETWSVKDDEFDVFVISHEVLAPTMARLIERLDAAERDRDEARAEVAAMVNTEGYHGPFMFNGSMGQFDATYRLMEHWRVRAQEAERLNRRP